MVVVAEFTEMTSLWWAHVVHWTRWARPCLVSIPCDSRTDLALEVTVNVMAELLNRTVSVGTDSDGRRYVRIEPETRHEELVLRD